MSDLEDGKTVNFLSIHRGSRLPARRRSQELPCSLAWPESMTFHRM